MVVRQIDGTKVTLNDCSAGVLACLGSHERVYFGTYDFEVGRQCTYYVARAARGFEYA